MAQLKQAVLALLTCAVSVPAIAQQAANRDEFFWLGEINKATAVINTEEGLLDRTWRRGWRQGISKVLAAGEPDRREEAIERDHIRASSDRCGRGRSDLVARGALEPGCMRPTGPPILRQNLLKLAGRATQQDLRISCWA